MLIQLLIQWQIKAKFCHNILTISREEKHQLVVEAKETTRYKKVEEIQVVEKLLLVLQMQLISNLLFLSMMK